MKNGQKKILLKIGISLLTVTVIFTACSYGFFKYGLKLFDSDFRNIYGIVCKNTNIFCQYIKEIETDEKRINVILKQQPAIYTIWVGMDSIDFYSAFNIYTELSDQYGNKEIYVSTGAMGSSDCTYSIDGGCFWFHFIQDDSEDSIYEMIEQILSNKNINKIILRHLNSLNNAGELCSVNTTVKYLCISTDLNVPNLSNFKGLNTLDIYVNIMEPKSELGWVSDDLRLNMDFLNELPQLETVTVNSYSSLINFSETECGSIKQFTLHTDECTDELEETIKTAFPNAEIEIIYDR